VTTSTKGNNNPPKKCPNVSPWKRKLRAWDLNPMGTIRVFFFNCKFEKPNCQYCSHLTPPIPLSLFPIILRTCGSIIHWNVFVAHKHCGWRSMEQGKTTTPNATSQHSKTIDSTIPSSSICHFTQLQDSGGMDYFSLC
jgi:hypothetical protein